MSDEINLIASGLSNMLAGSALFVEDLDCTMNIVTFTCPQWYNRKLAERLLKELKKRQIAHRVEWKFNKKNFLRLDWDLKLVLEESGREFQFILIG